MYKKIIKDIEQKWNKEKAELSKRYFKTWIWEYSEGDIFLWLNSADEKEIIKEYKNKLDLKNIEKLLKSNIHEYRAIALSLLRLKFEKSKTESEKKEIYELSMKNKDFINNWDLVDIFTPHVFWAYLYDKDREVLYDLVKSQSLWDRRIAIISTMYFVKKWDFSDAIKLSELLLEDKEDLIHKASWWILREIWKKDINELYKFLDKHHKIMPRTMLRYSIEKLDIEKRKHYMKK